MNANCMNSIFRRATLLLGWAFAAMGGVSAAEDGKAVSLRLRSGDYVNGKWLAVEAPAPGSPADKEKLLGSLQWQTSGLAQPLNVAWEQVAGVYLPLASAPPKPAGTHGFELATGDVIYGNLKSLTPQVIEIESTRFGMLRMPLESVRQMFANQNGEVVMIGPQGTKGWYSAIPKNPQQPVDPFGDRTSPQIEWVQSADRLKQWSDQGPPTTTVVGAQLRSEFILPAKSRIELEFSWQKRGEFSIYVGGGLKDRRDRMAFRIEVWDKELVLTREDDDVADVRSLQSIPAGAGSIRLQIFHDRAADRLIVFSGSGTALADMSFKLNARPPGGKPRADNNAVNGRAARAAVNANAANQGPNAKLPGVPDRAEANELVITNNQGDLRIDAIRVSAWNGVVPQLVDSTKPRLQRNSGQLELGTPIGYDATKKQIAYRTEQGERSEPLDQFTQIVLTEKRAQQTTNGVQLLLHDGTRIIGRPVSSGADRLRLRHASIEQELEVTLADLQTIAVALDEPSLAKFSALRLQQGAKTSTSVLRWEHGVLHGRLVDGKDSAEASCLVWQADGALAPTALSRDFSGRIVYRDKGQTAANATLPEQAANADGAPVVGAVRIMQRLVAGAIAPQAQAAKPATEGNPPVPSNNSPASSPPAAYRIHLRSGEVIPCHRLAIDDQGLRIESSVSTANRLPNDLIKAVEMLATAKPPKLTNVKRQRLLMLPRVNRDSPPTHIVRSVDGDYLRGRLLEMTDDRLTMEVRVETKQVPRALVSHIIWVHADEVDFPPGSVPPKDKSSSAKPTDAQKAEVKPTEGKPAETKPAETKPAVPSSGLVVQALRSDGVRMSFEPRETKSGVVTGVNRYLGDVRVNVGEVDELLVGKAIGEAVAQMPYSQWRWTAATLPKIVFSSENDGDGSRKPGADSPLVGKPAPDFKLPLLGGQEEFELSKQKGRIVVLDFWATWCGPCLKTMPILEKVVGEMPREAKVDLIAVNLEEAPRQITSMLERHKMKLTVALDQDGAVAAKYAATAIPQTVIIDREGKIVRLFVGSSPQFEKELRSALAELLGPPSNGGPVTVPTPPAAD